MPELKTLLAASYSATAAAWPVRPGQLSRGPLAGFFWVTVSAALLAGLGGFARAIMNLGVHPLEMVFFRNLTATLIFAPLLLVRGAELVRSEQLSLYTGRCAVSLISMQAWFAALALIPLGELTAIGFLAPLFGTVGAVVLLGEIVRARRWTALAIGFVGAMIVLRPSPTTFALGQMLAIAAAMTSGLVAVLVKQLTVRDDPNKIVFLSNAILTPMSLVPALFVWSWPPMASLPLLAGLGVCAVLGHMALVRGYAATDASLVQTFEFARLPFAVAIAFMAFGETIDVWTWIGALIILAAAVYIARREAALRQATRPLPSP